MLGSQGIVIKCTAVIFFPMVDCYATSRIKGKKMTAVHFITIPCEPNTACKVQGKPHFCSISPCAIDIMYTGFEDFIAFLYVFMNVVRVFVR